MRLNPNNPIGLRLSGERVIQNLTLRSLASKAGVSNAYISQIENGRIKDPGVGAIRKLSTALGVKPEWLAWGIAG